jgi:hypothetical protein
MTHPDGDTILKFALQVLDEPESLVVREHLSLCRQCSNLHMKALSDVARLENIEFWVRVPAPSRLPRRPRLTSDVWRWAAILATGFLLGYITANLSEPLRPIPVRQHLVPTSDPGDSSGFVSCPALDVKATFEGVR